MRQWDEISSLQGPDWKAFQAGILFHSGEAELYSSLVLMSAIAQSPLLY